MNEVVNQLKEMLGSSGLESLTHAIIGLVILIVGLFIVKLIVRIFGKLINKSDLIKRNNLTKPITSLAKGLLTIFVLVAVLQHFGLTDVLLPLRDMLNQFLSVIPNIIGAGIIAYAGWIIAKIVSELVTMSLSKLDKKISEKTGNNNLKVSKFLSAFIFGGILLPIIVAALGVLNIPAITVPASAMINKLMMAVPNIVAAGIILLVTYFVTRFVIFVLSGLLEGMDVNSLPEKLGLKGFLPSSFKMITLISQAIMFFSMLTASTAAVNILGIEVISDIFSKVLSFGGGILIGLVILVIGNLLGSIAYNKLSTTGNKVIAQMVRFAILGLVTAMGLKSMGLADHIVNLAFGFIIGGISIAFALAFGIGGRDAAKTLADKWVSKIK